MYRIIVVPVRVIHAVVAWWWYWMEVAADGIAHLFFRTEYVRTGSCARCGVCCRGLAVEMPLWLAHRERLVAWVVRWHDIVLNFEFKGRDGRWLLYSCRHCREEKTIDGIRAVCGVRHFRPRLCRFYPRAPLHGHPSLHPSCGYGFVRRDGRPSFDEVLRQRRRASSPHGDGA